MLKLVHDGSESAVPGGPAAGSSLLDEIVRDGARRMLAAALQAEVTAYVDQFVDEVDENGHRLVVRNGYHEPGEVVTAAGAVPVRQPRVNDKRVDPETGERGRFASSILPAWARKSLGGRGCCRCCTCTGSPHRTPDRRWSSSLARRRGSPLRRSPG